MNFVGPLEKLRVTLLFKKFLPQHFHPSDKQRGRSWPFLLTLLRSCMILIMSLKIKTLNIEDTFKDFQGKEGEKRLKFTLFCSHVEKLPSLMKE